MSGVAALSAVLDDRTAARGVTPRALIAEIARQRSRGNMVLAEQAWRQAIDCVSVHGLSELQLEAAIESTVEQAQREGW